MIRFKPKTKAFTLIELIVVIVILGILAAIAVPTFAKVIDNSKLNTATATVGSLARETLALAVLDANGTVTLENVQTAFNDLQPVSASNVGVYAADEYKLVVAPEFSSDAKTISVSVTDGVVGLATLVPGVGCAYAKGSDANVNTWGKNGASAEECNGGMGAAGPDAGEAEEPTPEPTEETTEEPAPEPVAPAAPYNVGAALVEGSIALGWEEVVSSSTAPVSGYRVYAGFSSSSESQARAAASSSTVVVSETTDFSYVISDATGVGFYCFSVSTYGPAGESERSSVSCTEVEDARTFTSPSELEIRSTNLGFYDSFGMSLAVHGDTMIVSAPTEYDPSVGNLYVFTKDSATGLWVETSILEAPSSSGLGVYDLAFDGTTLVANSIEDSMNSGMGSFSGAVYVFTKSGSSWSGPVKLTDPTPEAGAWFGKSVSVDGNVLAVGAPFDDTRALDAGAVHLFKKSGGSWVYDTVRTADGAAAGSSNFGYSVSVNSETLAVGATGDVVSGVKTGAVYVPSRSNGTWSQPTRLVAPGLSASSLFGASVSFDGATLVAGATGSDSMTGSAYVFTKNESSWSNGVKLNMPGAQGGDSLGYSVDVSGSRIVVGALSDAGRGADSGAVYVLVKNGSSWVLEKELIPSGGVAGDKFGFDVAIDGFTVLASSPYSGTAGYMSGLAYLYQGN